MREVLVNKDLTIGVAAVTGERVAAKPVDVEPLGRLVGPLDEQRVLGCADDEVGCELHRTALEEHLESSLLTTTHTVEHGDEVAHHAVAVLDRERSYVLDGVAEH